jgi:hypothetical protein
MSTATLTMHTLLLAVMLAASPAAAQVISYDPDAMGKILAGTQALKVKHSGRPAHPMIGVYEPQHLRFEPPLNAAEQSIHILHKDTLITVVKLTDLEWMSLAGERLIESLETMRVRAEKQGSLVEIDYDVIARHEKTGVWDRLPLRVQGDARNSAL